MYIKNDMYNSDDIDIWYIVKIYIDRDMIYPFDDNTCYTTYMIYDIYI